MPPHRGGNPPLDPSNPSVSVHLRVPSPQYDALYERARQGRVSVPEVIRRELKRAAEDEDED